MARFEHDTQLLERCRAGDAAAWDVLVLRYRRLVWSAIVGENLRDEAAEDVFQLVFTSLFEHLGSVRDDEALPSWLLTTTKRHCWRTINRIRTERAQSLSLDTGVAQAVDPEDEQADSSAIGALAERQLVRDALERLGGKCRELLEALFGAAGEPNYALISAKLGIRVGSIGPTRARCLEKLAGVLSRLGYDRAMDNGNPRVDDETD